MFDSIDLIVISKWLGIGTLVSAALTLLAFVLKWGIRFRAVGVTSFMGLLTIGVFALNLSLYQRIAIEGAEQFTLVYDGGGAQVVIAMKPEVVTPEAVRATLEQAANDLYSPGRLGQGEMTVRARTMLHPEAGISEPLYVGQVKRNLINREDTTMKFEVDTQAIARVAS